MGKTVSSGKIKLRNVRAAFVNLDKADYFKPGQPGPNETKKRRITFLLDPSNADHAKTIQEIKEAAKKCAEQTWPDGIPKSLDKCYGLGNDQDKVYEGFKDMWFIRTARKEDDGPGAIVGRRRTGPNGKDGKPTFVQLEKGQKEFPYGGCYVNATISLWVLNNHGQKRIMANYEAIQFANDGKSFSGRTEADANSEFDALEDAPATGASGEAEDPFD